MTFDSYELQVLVSVSKGCKPNSPKLYRAWNHIKPLRGIPQFGNALSALVRAGLLQRGQGFSVKPSARGYDLIGQWRAYRRELKRRPILYALVIWDRPIELQFNRAA